MAPVHKLYMIKNKKAVWKYSENYFQTIFERLHQGYTTCGLR